MTRAKRPAGRAAKPEGWLSGRVALIAGADGSFGAALVQRYVEAGARVVLVGRDLARLEAAAQQASGPVRGAPDNTLVLPLDAADPAAARRGVEQALQHYGRLDVLVNIIGNTGSAHALRDRLAPCWHLCRAAVPHLQVGARVINVATRFAPAGYTGLEPHAVDPAVADAVLAAFTRHLAQQLGVRGVRVHFGSDESAALTAQGVVVSDGREVEAFARSTVLSRPDLRTLDGEGSTVLVAGGEPVEEALAVARILAGVGAQVLLGLGSVEQLQRARAALEQVAADCPDERDARIELLHFERGRPGGLAAALSAASMAQAGRAVVLQGAVVLPTYDAAHFSGDLVGIGDAQIQDFLSVEITGAIAVARELRRHWQQTASSESAPRVVFLSGGDDRRGNVYADMLRAAIEGVIGAWRHERGRRSEAGGRADEGAPARAVEWPGQVVRWSCAEAEALPFAAAEAARMLFMPRQVPEASLYLPASLSHSTGTRRALLGAVESLIGLHRGKCVLITGGSAGIGGQLSRLLAIAGARVMISARREQPLEALRAAIVSELEDIGYSRPQERVRICADIDVGSEPALQQALAVTLAAFGRIDYLINNAGVAGAEQMVVDLEPEAWRATLRANLNSNYSLIEKVVPLMKQQGSGYILNVSSCFGGEKHIAVPYPNRADYAVSKAGQRALVEDLARFVGPEIQINAIAPGPVDGQRLRGKDGQAGLFDRRALLIRENRRLNRLHEAVLATLGEGATIERVFEALASNAVAQLATTPTLPAALRVLTASIADEGDPDRATPAHSSPRFLMTASIASRLVQRLRNGCVLEDEQALQRALRWARSLPEPPQPFMDPLGVQTDAVRIRDGVIDMLHLRRMPTEADVALATVFFMADRAISGETFEPSGGLQQRRTNTERELFGGAGSRCPGQLAGGTVWLFGEHLSQHLATAARLLLTEARVGHIVLLTRTPRGSELIVESLGSGVCSDSLTCLTIGEALEDGIDRACRTHGPPDVVVSTPFEPVPARLLGNGSPAHLDAAGFAALVEANLTHHFRIARRVSLFEGARLILVSPDVPLGGTAEQFALANFIKTALHALTATLGVENGRLCTDVGVNQVNLTRRLRGEEPSNAAEHAAECQRFAEAVLLAAECAAGSGAAEVGAPRLQRGLAITV